MEQGATQRALALYQEISTINPRSEAVRRRMADIWLQQGNLEQALTVYQEMIDIAPQRATGYALMGQALFEAKHYEEAIKFLEQALQRDPKEPDLLWEMLGESYAALEQWAEAMQTYEQAIDLNPNSQRAYALMGEAQCQVGTPGEARFYFEQAIALGNQQEQVRQAIQYIAQQGICPP
jgi:tetratricopeptide (TPR) repeat protein